MCQKEYNIHFYKIFYAEKHTLVSFQQSIMIEFKFLPFLKHTLWLYININCLDFGNQLYILSNIYILIFIKIRRFLIFGSGFNLYVVIYTYHKF